MKPEEVLLKYHSEDPKWICLAQDKDGTNNIYNIDDIFVDTDEWIYGHSSKKYDITHETIILDIEWDSNAIWTDRIITLSDLKLPEKDISQPITFVTKQEHDNNRLKYLIDFMDNIVKSKQIIPSECLDEYNQLLKVINNAKIKLSLA